MVKIKLNDIDLEDTIFMSRLDFDETRIESLAEDIRKLGQRNPIGLREHDEKLQIIYGWSRIKAIQRLGRDEIDAKNYGKISDLEAQMHNISDNVHREDLTPLEIAYQVEKLREKFDIPVQRIAEIYGGKNQYVYDLLTLTEMKEEIKEAVHLGKIGLTHAIEINKHPDSNQLEILRDVIEQGLSVSQIKKIRMPESEQEPEPEKPSVEELKEQLTPDDLRELALESEYKRFRKFLCTQVNKESDDKSLDENIESWINNLKSVGGVYGWGIQEVIEKINTMIFEIIRAREFPDGSGWLRGRTNTESMTELGLRNDKPSPEMSVWFIKEAIRWDVTHCNHEWVKVEYEDKELSYEMCNNCICTKEHIYNPEFKVWKDPPYEEPFLGDEN